MTFKNYSSYKKFCENNKENGLVFENEVKPEIQFLAEYYYNIQDDKLKAPKLRINFFDIEVVSEKLDETLKVKFRKEENTFYAKYSDYFKNPNKFKDTEYFDEQKKAWLKFTEKAFYKKGGFPDPLEAEFPVTIITCYDNYFNKTYTFGYKDYSGPNLEESWYEYIKCRDEEDLLKKFVLFINKTQPDVLTGWNADNFDIAYIVNRLEKFVKKGKEIVKYLSPIEKVFHYTTMGEDSQKFNIDIAGISVLDYCSLYKKYAKPLLGLIFESFKLDFVAKKELEKGKYDFAEEASNLTDLYNNNFNAYTDYNVIDVKRVKQLHEKRNFISVIQTLSLVAKNPMNYHEHVTSLIEAVMLVYYRRNNLCAEHIYDGSKQDFLAGYCKQPQIGKHYYVVDLDITSSYPHAMMACNMGSNTFMGRIYQLMDGDAISSASEEDIIKNTRKREFPDFSYVKHGKIFRVVDEDLDNFNKSLKNGEISIAPNGSMYSNKTDGILAVVVKYLFSERVKYKNKMKDAGKQRGNYKDNSKEFIEYNFLYELYKSLQVAFKLLINSMYGATSVPYSRIFESDTASAITSVGRHAVLSGQKYANIILNNPERSEKLMNIFNKMRAIA